MKKSMIAAIAGASIVATVAVASTTAAPEPQTYRFGPITVPVSKLAAMAQNSDEVLAAAVVDVSVSGADTLRSAGVYVGDGLILANNGTSAPGREKYKVTFANKRQLDATAIRSGSGLLLLKVDQADGLPQPVKVSWQRPALGDTLVTFGLSTVPYVSPVPRHTMMATGYVGARSVIVSDDATAPRLTVIQLENAPKAEFGPVFQNGELVGMASSLSNDGTIYMVAGDEIAPRLAKLKKLLGAS